MFEKILLATDGSETALKAAQAAGKLATKTQGTITLLFVMEPFNEMAYISLPGYELGIDPEKVARFQRESANAVLERTAEVLRPLGVPFVSRYGNWFAVRNDCFCCGSRRIRSDCDWKPGTWTACFHLVGQCV